VTPAPSAEEVLAIHQLLGLYGHLVDGGHLDRLDEVFAAEATFDAYAFGQGIHRGLDAIRAIFALGSPPHPPAHLATNIFVYRKGDRTLAHSKWLTIDAATGRVRSGDYHDELVNGPAGWRIAHRAITIRFYVGDAPEVRHDD
jgi:SnoaL-like domain